MAKIDRLGWADGMSFIAYGVRVGVRVNDSAILKDLTARLPPGSKPAAFAVVDHLYSIIGSSANSNSKVRRLNLGYWNLLRFARAREFDSVLEAFESHVQLTVAEFAPRRVFVHAGVVEWKVPEQATVRGTLGASWVNTDNVSDSKASASAIGDFIAASAMGSLPFRPFRRDDV